MLLQEYRERLFTVMNDIDQRVETIRKKAILLVGLSRVGKSTCYNWALKHPLVAKRQEIIVQKKGKKTKSDNVSYVPEQVRVDSAQVKKGYLSCTLVPNIVGFGQNVSLADMAGYGDSRDYVGTLGVSYSLKAVLQSVEQVKFLIVIEQKTLMNHFQLCRTFGHFLSMFNFSFAGEQFKQNVFRSTSLLITQSINSISHFKMIEQCIDQLDDQRLNNINYRQLIVELLQHIHQQNRFDSFKQAQIGFPPQTCGIFQRFQGFGWPYLNLKGIDQFNIITLPFQQQFKVIDEKEKSMFINGIQKRFKSYTNFSTIFSTMIEDYLAKGIIHDIKIDYTSFFQKIDTFIKENDHYDTGKLINELDFIVPQFFKPQKITLLKLILQIHQIFAFKEQDISRKKEKSKQTMSLFHERIRQFIEVILIIFCRNKNEYKKILQVKYILQRGMREFYMLLGVAEDYASRSINTVKDSLEGILNKNIHSVLSNLINSFHINQQARITFGSKNPDNMLENYLNSRQNVYGLQFFFQIYHRQFMQMQTSQKEIFLQLKRDTKIIHAKQQYKLCNYKQSIEYLLQAIKYEFKYQKCFKQGMPWDYPQPKMAQKIQIMYINQETIFEMIQINLIKMGKLQIALQLSRVLHWVDSVCEIFELIIKDQSISKQKRYTIIEEYAQYCNDHGRREKGLILFQQLLQGQKRNFNQKRRVRQLIQDSIRNEKQYKDNYNNFLSNLDNISLQNNALLQLQTKIKESLNKNSPNYSDFFKTNNILATLDFNSLNQNIILQQYLEDRFNNEAAIAANGFAVKNLQLGQQAQLYKGRKAKCVDSFLVTNLDELRDLNSKLLKTLDALSKSAGTDTERFIRIDLERIKEQQKQIEQRHLAIILRKQTIQPTFEYATRTMKKIKKIVKEPHTKLINLVKKSLLLISRLNQQLAGLLKERYFNSADQAQIKGIISIVYKNSKEPNSVLQEIYRKDYPNSVLVRSELYDIFEEIKSKLQALLILHAEQESNLVNQSVGELSRSYENRFM